MMYIVEDDTKEEVNNNVRASSSSRLSNDILLLVFSRGISCCLDNHYPGHNSHLLLLYKKEKEKHNMYCGVKICFTSANIIKIVHCPHR